MRRAGGPASLPRGLRRFLPLAAAPALAVCLLLQGARASAADRPPSPAGDLARLLAGTFQGSSPGNDLTIVSTPLGGSPVLQLQKLEVRVTGAYQGDAVLLRGLWRISYQGDAVWLVFIPGVDPLEAARRFSDPTFSPTELEAGCWVVLAIRGRAFEGRIKTFPNCRDALRAGAVQRVDKEWSVHLAPDELRFENAETGEALSFSRAAGRKR